MNERKAPLISGVVTAITAANVIAFLLIVLALAQIWPEMNDFLNRATGWRTNWILIVLAATAALVLWFVLASVRLLRRGTKIRRRFRGVALATAIPTLLVWNGMLYLIASKAGEELGSIRWQASAALAPACILFSFFLGLAFYSHRRRLSGAKGLLANAEAMKTASPSGKFVRAFSAIGFAACLVLPLAFRPAFVYDGALPPRPKIIAHRGVADLAPENTIAAARKALALGLAGIEVDVALSADEIPFLMHDDDLRRTTDVAAKFPARKGEKASRFTFAELSTLDAGSWFAAADPFRTIASGAVVSGDLAAFARERVPSLEALLALVKGTGLLVDVDIKAPPLNADRAAYLAPIFSTILVSGMANHVIVAAAYNPPAGISRAANPVGGTIPGQSILRDAGLLNVHHAMSDETYRELERQGILVMAWTVDSPLRFSELWLLGADYVKTNRPELLLPLQAPALRLTTAAYVAMSAGGALLAFLLGAILTATFGRLRKKRNT